MSVGLPGDALEGEEPGDQALAARGLPQLVRGDAAEKVVAVDEVGHEAPPSGSPASPWRPAQRASADDVKMDVRDFLAGISARIEDDPVAAVVNALLARRPAGGEEELAEKGVRALGRVLERREMELGDDQDVDRGLGPDVLEGQDTIGLEQDRGRQLAAHDAAEEAVAGRRGAHERTLSIEAPSPRSFSSIRS
jgi:hypothetical protein